MHAIQNKNSDFPRLLLMFYTIYFMPCVDIRIVLRRFILWLFESIVDLFPEHLTNTLTVLEIVYYIIACIYFFCELIGVLLSFTKT